MKARLNIDRIAKGLGAEPMGKVTSSGGYFSAMQVVSDIKARLRVPEGGGRPTDREWTERRVLPLRRRTLERLEKITAKIRGSSGIKVEVMQLAALLVEKDVERLSLKKTEELLGRARRASRSRKPRKVERKLH